MLKVLLIDDEEIIIRGLQKLIDWGSLGLEIAGTASNGECGLILAEKLRPDIVIVDIKMRQMSGLDFAEKYLLLNPSSRIIALTGYSEFEYARRAVNLGLFGFLLKPIDKTELYNTLKAAAAELERFQKERLSDEGKESSVAELTREREKYFSALLGDDTVARAPLLDYDSYTVMLIASEMQDKSNDIKKELKSFLENRGVCVFFVWRQSGLVLIIPERDSDKRDIFELAAAIAIKTKEILKKAAVGIGHRTRDVSEIRSAYKGAKHAVRRMFFVDEDYIDEATAENSILIPSWTMPDVEDKLIKTVLYGPENQIKPYTEEFCNYIFSVCGYDEHAIRDMASGFVMKLSSKMEKNGESVEELTAFYRRIPSVEKWSRLKSELAAAFENACVRIRETAASAQKADVVEKAKIFIDKNYSRPITIEMLTGELFITATYFCYLFKQKTGIGYHEYLQNKRMSEAIKLVASQKYKIYEIAERVGYGNARYFSEVFKKYYGILPTEFNIEKHRYLLERSEEKNENVEKPKRAKKTNKTQEENKK